MQHLVFIPFVFLIGMSAGFVFGARAARQELAQKRKKAKE